MTSKGQYIVAAATPTGTMISHIPPIDTSTPKTWADSLVKRGRAVIDHGFGICCDGTPYDLENFLADMAGDVPWNPTECEQVMTELFNHPEFRSTELEFQAKYGHDYFTLNPVKALHDNII